MKTDALTGSSAQKTRVLSEFQNEDNLMKKGCVRVLLLNLGDESASGANLTTANHLVFVHPLVAKSQQKWTQQEAQAAVNNASENISFFTIGLGDEIDENTLSQIGTSGSVFATDSSELETVFNQVSNNVANQANSFYLFEYCSPKRDGSGINNLVIQALSNDRTGVVEASFDATGFSSGCQ